MSVIHPVLAAPTGASVETIEPDVALKLYRSMLLIRSFEERLRRLYMAGIVPGLLHLSAGQEAAAVGICSALDRNDWIASNHRGHGHCLAKGSDPRGLMAEILGKATGLCGGRSGSMHAFDRSTGNLGTNGIVGGGIPLATGAALSAKLRKSGQVAVCFFGDGALNQGLFHECLNMASLWALPVVYVCENNGYGEYTALWDVTAGKCLTARGTVFDIQSEMLDGMDLLEVRNAAVAALARARRGEGPSFLILNTYRYNGHHVTDDQKYKSREEVEEWEAKDPILRFSKYLVGMKFSTQAQLDAVRATVEAEIDGIVDSVKKSPPPRIECLRENLYA